MNYSECNIIFFDGVCNFCNATVNIVFSNNKKKDIYFSSLQSDFAKQFLSLHAINASDFDTVIFYAAGKFHFRSSAILQVCKHLRGGYQLLSAFLIIPTFIRDGIYNWFAKNRYKFYGKKETCRVPSAEEKQYFLE